jgi:hypothetical protein
MSTKLNQPVCLTQATDHFLTKRERRAKQQGGVAVEEETPAQRAARRRAAEAIQATQGLRGIDLSWFMGQQINDQVRNRASRYTGPEDAKTQALVRVSAKDAQAAAAASEWVKAFFPGGGKAAVDYKYFGEGGLPEGGNDPLPYYAPDMGNDGEAPQPSDALKALQEAAARRQGGQGDSGKEGGGWHSGTAQRLEEEYWRAPKQRAHDSWAGGVGRVFEYSADGKGVKRRVSFAKAHAIKNMSGEAVYTGLKQGVGSRAPAGVNSFQESLQKRAGSEWVSRLPAVVALFQAVRVGLTYEEAAEATSFAAHELNSISEVIVAANSGVVPRMLFSGVAWYTIAAGVCALVAGALAVVDESKALQAKGGVEGGEEAGGGTKKD